MGAAENTQTVRDMFAALNRADSDGFFGYLSDDIRWTISGTTAFSHTFTGKADIIERLLSPLTQQLEGSIKNMIHNTVAEGDYVVVQSQGESMTKTGTPYNNSYCLVMRLRDGKVHRITEYLDTELVTAVFGN